MTAVRAEGLGKGYGSGAARRAALSDATLVARFGELLVVRGPSGSGKTTLLTLLAGLERPDAGRAWIGDLEVSAADDGRLAALRTDTLGFVPQESALVPMLSAAENVELPLRWARTDPAARDAQVADALAHVGLSTHARQRADRLSGGQQQRVALARALVGRPRVILADEPTSQLDSGTARDVVGLLAERAHRDGAAVVVTTHDAEVLDRADRVLTLVDGRLSGA